MGWDGRSEPVAGQLALPFRLVAAPSPPADLPALPSFLVFLARSRISETAVPWRSPLSRLQEPGDTCNRGLEAQSGEACCAWVPEERPSTSAETIGVASPEDPDNTTVI